MFNWLAFLTYAFITAATPGPNNIMSMSNGGRLGFRGALPFNFGIWAGFSAVMLLCTAFCTTLTNLIPAVKTPMLIAGAAYMLHLAWGTYRSSGVIEESHSRSGFYAGMLLQFIGLHFALLRRRTADAGTVCAATRLYRLCLYAVLVCLRFSVPLTIQPPQPNS